MPLSQVQAGMKCTGETVVQGTTISSFGVQVIDVVDQPGEGARILVQVSGPAVASTGVAEGFSGSPVYCPDSFGTMENAGAISEGIGQYGNNVALVTPIEQMLGEPVQPPPDAPRLAVKPRPLLGPLTVGGLSPAVFGVLQRAGERAGRLILASPAGGQVTNFPVQPLDSRRVGERELFVRRRSDGRGRHRHLHRRVDRVRVRARARRRRPALAAASGRVRLLRGEQPRPDDPPSYKLASPGHTEGILSSDTPNAVIGEVGAPPPTVPVDVTAQDLDTGQSVSLDTQVADETDVGLPLGSSLVDTIAPLEVAQAATQIYDGPPADRVGAHVPAHLRAREPRRRSGSATAMSAQAPRATRASRRLSSPSAASGDVTTAFGRLGASRLRRAPCNARGRRHRSAAGPGDGEHRRRARALPVKAGRTVKLRLLVRVYRGRRRTVSFRLRVPAGASGPLAVTIHGPAAPPPASTNSLSSSLVDLAVRGVRIDGERERTVGDLLAPGAAGRDRVDPDLRRAVRERAGRRASAACSATRRC